MADSCLDENSRSEEEEAQLKLDLGDSELTLEDLRLSKTRDVLQNLAKNLYKEFMPKTGLDENHKTRRTKIFPREFVESAYVGNTLQNNDLDSAFELLKSLGSIFSNYAVPVSMFTGVSVYYLISPDAALHPRIVDMNLANHAGNRPIHLAFKGCRKSVVELLLSHGADYVCKNNDGVQPIHLAAEMNFVDGLKLLLVQSNIDVEAEDERGSTPIHYCCTVDSNECLQILLDHGANIYHKNAFGDSSIHVAMFQSATKCARLLFECEASRTCRDSLVTPTTTAGPRLLIEPPAPKSTGLLARLISKEKRTSSCSNLSIISGVSDYDPELLINLTDCEGFTPLHMAVSSGNLELVKICLLQRADILAKDLTGQIPLHFACARGDLDCVRLMTEFRPRLKPRMIREPNNDGRTPMHVAAMHNSTEVIDYLVSQGAELNPSDRKRFTPLSLACSKGAIKASLFLMELGADLTACDEFGRNMLIMVLLSGAGKARDLVPALIRVSLQC
ncbi:hypothetical protein AHF37_03530 [Paragonimus kellicotti]|nr:hypothetical protein AHF37_03530 [Paragonimus kellicotti]